MNKETRYLYVMSPTFVAGSVCFTAIAIPDPGDQAPSERELVREAQRSSARTANNRRWAPAATRLAQTFRRLARRILQRRPVQAGAAA